MTEWQPPGEAVEAISKAAANTSNADLSEFRDFIYAEEFEMKLTR